MNLSRLLVPSFFALGALATAGRAAPLTETTAVLSRPDPSAPVIAFLKAGSEATPAAVAPDGWMAVTLAGPFEGYVQNSDLTKGLDVKPGASIYLAPKDGAGVLETMTKGDSVAITGLRGKWTQVRLSKALVGYIHLGALPAANTAAEAPPAVAAAQPPPPPLQPNAPGRPVADGAGSAGSELSRIFEGTFASSHWFLAPHRLYDWQLDDSSGTRIAFLDMSKMLLTDQIESYVNHTVAVYGSVKKMPDGENIVIAVESMQLK